MIDPTAVELLRAACFITLVFVLSVPVMAILCMLGAIADRNARDREERKQ